jgi:DNA-binding transcriptional LysR family regulator
MSKLPDFEAWAVFAKVAEAGSFSRAARELGLSDPTVSKAISRLEARLGVSLVHRTSRGLSLTDSGRSAVERARRILQDGEALEVDTQETSSSPRGLVRLAAPLSFGLAHLGPLTPGFLESYPDVTLEMAFSDRFVDLVAEGFDLAIRIGPMADSGLLARRLAPVRLRLVGAPAYLDRHGRPQHPRELKDHQGFCYTGGQAKPLWRFTHPQEAEVFVSPNQRLRTDNADVITPAVLAGLGLALQPDFLVWREIQVGALEVVLPGWEAPQSHLHLLMPASRLRPRRVEVLIEFLSKRLSAPPWAAENRR